MGLTVVQVPDTKLRREITSFWYPTWLAQPAALVPGSKLSGCTHHTTRQWKRRIERSPLTTNW